MKQLTSRFRPYKKPPPSPPRWVQRLLCVHFLHTVIIRGKSKSSHAHILHTRLEQRARIILLQLIKNTIISNIKHLTGWLSRSDTKLLLFCWNLSRNGRHFRLLLLISTFFRFFSRFLRVKHGHDSILPTRYLLNSVKKA